MARRLPMFPLGSVVFPHMVVPLHVFEPRYRALARDVVDGDREFGITLISRGHEVGGGDERFGVGTVARILQHEELEDGRWLVVAIGTRRFRVRSWLDDAPYPLAEVDELAEPAADGLDDELADVAQRLRRALALRSELEEPVVPPDMPLHEDPSVASFQVAALAGLTPFDAQEVLEAGDTEKRLGLLGPMLDDVVDALRFRLGG